MRASYGIGWSVPSPRLRRATNARAWVCYVLTELGNVGVGMTYEQAYIRWIEEYARIHAIPSSYVSRIVHAVVSARLERAVHSGRYK